MAADRPSFVAQLLSRPLPPLTPARLTDHSNPPWREEFQSQTADLKCHPLLESALHLMNDDLFSAHFLLRKMQEDEWGKWLHAILHQAEGDLEKNAKLWYKEVDPSVLGVYWGKIDASDPAKAAIDNMYLIMKVKGGGISKEEEDKAKRTRWEELVCVMEHLEEKFGWGSMDGTEAYTKDEKPEHKSRILGEGYRTFDKQGRSDR